MIKPELTKIDEARYLAISAHANRYGEQPYFYHLEHVVAVLKYFGYGDSVYIIAGYLHDTIEDAALSYNKIKTRFGKEVAEIVLACTDPIDLRNRKEKKRAVYRKLSGFHKAIIVKLADRIANVENSIITKNADKFGMYTDERDEFLENLYVPNSGYEEMWTYLEKLFEDNTL